MSRVALVTGGAGFIGTNIIERLLTEKWNVLLLDNLSRFGAKNNIDFLKSKGLKNSQIHIGDIRDYKVVKNLVKKADVVYHMAGQVAVTNSFLNPREDFEINALGTLNVLEAARESGHKPIIIYPSTNKVYGNMEGIQVKQLAKRYAYAKNKFEIKENQPLDFHSPYGCSKGVGDQYVADYYRMYGIPTIVFRQSCIYGPHQMGIEDQGWVAHLAAKALLKMPITLFGDGRQVRDLLHVSDLIDAYQLGVKHITTKKGQVFNIGGGNKNSLSLLEYIAFLEKKLKRKLPITFAPWRPGDQKVYISDTRKLARTLSWRPRISWQEGLGDLLQWVGENTKLFEKNLKK